MRAVFIAAYALAALAATVPAVNSAKRWRESSFAAPITVTLLGVFEWCIAQTLSTAATSLKVALFFNYAIFPGVCTVVIGFRFQAMVMAKHRSGLSRSLLRLLLIHPVLVMLAVATDPWTHWFYTGAKLQPSGMLTIYPGPLYWMHTAYSYLMLGYSVVLAFKALFGAVSGHRRVFALYLIGALTPAAGNIVTVTHNLDRQSGDLTPIMFLVTAMVWWHADRGFALTKVIPVAYEQVVTALTDAVIVLDPDGKLLAVNPAAAGLCRTTDPERVAELVGTPWHEALDEAFTAAFGTGPPSGNKAVPLASGRVLDVRVIELRSDRDRHFGWVMVAQDVTEIERLRADLADQAVRDPLTNLLNRRYLNDALPRAIERARATGEPIAVIMIDIDHFKQVNDTFGHATGDLVLVGLTKLLSSSIRSADTVVRFGGEEFLAVLPGATAEQATERADRWRRICEVAEIESPDGLVRVTFSAGVTELDPADTPEQLLLRADAALYSAKGNGRNQVVCASMPNPKPGASARPFQPSTARSD